MSTLLLSSFLAHQLSRRRHKCALKPHYWHGIAIWALCRYNSLVPHGKRPARLAVNYFDRACPGSAGCGDGGAYLASIPPRSRRTVLTRYTVYKPEVRAHVPDPTLLNS